MYAKAMVNLDSEERVEAMRSISKSMDDNRFWDLVDLPAGAQPLVVEWVFKKETNVDGNV